MTFLTPEMLATASSTRLVTCVSSSLGATPGSRDRDVDDRHVDVGEARDRQLREAHQAERHEHDEQQDRRNRVADRPGGEVPVHGLIAPVASPRTGVTMSPSATKVPARDTTSCAFRRGRTRPRPKLPARTPSSTGTRRDLAVLDDLQECVLTAAIHDAPKPARRRLRGARVRLRRGRNCRRAARSRWRRARCGWRRGATSGRPRAKCGGSCP